MAWEVWLYGRRLLETSWCKEWSIVSCQRGQTVQADIYSIDTIYVGRITSWQPDEGDVPGPDPRDIVNIEDDSDQWRSLPAWFRSEQQNRLYWKGTSRHEHRNHKTSRIALPDEDIVAPEEISSVWDLSNLRSTLINSMTECSWVKQRSWWHIHVVGGL